MENFSQKENNQEVDIIKDLDVKQEVLPTVLDLQDRFVLVNVGTELHPAETNEIEEIREKLTDLFNDNGIKCVYFVTHHAVKISIIK